MSKTMLTVETFFFFSHGTGGTCFPVVLLALIQCQEKAHDDWCPPQLQATAPSLDLPTCAAIP